MNSEKCSSLFIFYLDSANIYPPLRILISSPTSFKIIISLPNNIKLLVHEKIINHGRGKPCLSYK